MPRPKAEIIRFVDASRQLRLLVRNRDALVSRLGTWKTWPKVLVIFIAMFWMSFIATAVLGTVNADGHKGWPHWLVPLPVAVCGIPFAFSIFVYICIWLSTCRFLCRRRRVRQEMLHLGPLRDDQAVFDSMAAAMLSNSLRVDLEQAHNEMEHPSIDLEPLQRSLHRSCPSTPLDMSVTVPIWSSAVLTLTGMPALISLAPLYGICIVASMILLAVCTTDLHRNERWGLAYLSLLSLAISVSIFVLGLQLDGVLHSSLAVAVVFWVLVAIMGIGYLIALMFGFDRAPCWRTMSGLLSWALAMASASAGIAALLEKTTGGMLAVIPYSVIVFVMLVCVPGCSFFWALLAFYV